MKVPPSKALESSTGIRMPRRPPGPVRTVDDALDRLELVRQDGSGWVANCPAHDDHNQSLSVHVGDDGRILLHCDDGCVTPAIVQALDITMADLSPQRVAPRRSDDDQYAVIGATDEKPPAAPGTTTRRRSTARLCTATGTLAIDTASAHLADFDAEDNTLAACIQGPTALATIAKMMMRRRAVDRRLPPAQPRSAPRCDVRPLRRRHGGARPGSGEDRSREGCRPALRTWRARRGLQAHPPPK